MQPTRRDFLKIAAMLSGAAGVSGFVPESVQRALAIEPAPGSTYADAEHIVILMQENRSFDHALGTLKGVRGFNDPRAIRQANGNSIFVQSDAAGQSYAPWRLDIRDTKITWMGSIPHTRQSQVDAWNEGRHDGWLDAKRSSVSPQYAAMPLTMGHYTREDLPFYYALADAFTVCDQSYSSAMTSTTPNRSLFWTGTVREEQRVGSKVFIRNNEILSGGMTWKTFPERLQEAGIAWKFYQNELTNAGGLSEEEDAWLSNFGCNLLEYFAAYNVKAYSGAVLYMQQELAALTSRADKLQKILAAENSVAGNDPRNVARLTKRLTDDQAYIAKLRASLADSGEALYEQMSEAQRALHDAAFHTNRNDPAYRSLEEIRFEGGGEGQEMAVPKGDILYQFRKDVNEGRLPAVSWLSAPENFSDHPISPWYGAWYVSEVMDILTKNPEVWKKTIFLLTYDENDGYFDHAPSFVAADPKRPDTGGASAGIDTGMEYTYAADELRMGVPARDARTAPIGMGFRVPTIVASPWSRGGWVNSQLFDHTSTLMFLEDFVAAKFGKTVKEENISAWRRAISGNLTSCFRANDAKEVKLEYLNRDTFVTGIQRAKDKEVPSNYKLLSAAEIAAINEDLQTAGTMPHQEPGMRPACPLPYELYADGALSADGTQFELRLTAGNSVHGERSAGAPFNVYLRGAKEMTVATYAVRAGDTMRQEFPLSMFPAAGYAIDVHAPNGFYRSFTGDGRESALRVETSYERRREHLTGNLRVLLHNSGTRAVTVSVSDHSYNARAEHRTVAAGGQAAVVLDLKRSHGWYDFSVKANGSATEARFAGRVETGRPSVSDPLMGAVV